MPWQGTVEAIGKNTAGDQKLVLRYTIERKRFGRMEDSVLRTIDSPGKMYIATVHNDGKWRLIDVVGHFDNYVSFGQKYRFKQA